MHQPIDRYPHALHKTYTTAYVYCQHHIDSLTNPRNKHYTVMSTPRILGRIGTVNSCTCSFFAQTHSACKHMYIIARRLRFNIKETVAVEPTPHLRSPNNVGHNVRPPNPPSGNLPTGHLHDTHETKSNISAARGAQAAHPLTDRRPHKDDSHGSEAVESEGVAQSASSVAPRPAKDWCDNPLGCRIGGNASVTVRGPMNRPRASESHRPRQRSIHKTDPSTPLPPAETSATDVGRYWDLAGMSLQTLRSRLFSLYRALSPRDSRCEPVSPRADRSSHQTDARHNRGNNRVVTPKQIWPAFSLGVPAELWPAQAGRGGAHRRVGGRRRCNRGEPRS